MIMTRVLGSGLLAQERVAARRTATDMQYSALRKIETKRKVRPGSRLVSARERAFTFARDDRFAAALGIRDLSQNRWPFGAGGGGNVGRSVVPRLIRQQGEGGGFFGCGGQSEFIRGSKLQVQRPKFVGQHGEQRGIIRPATGDHQLSKLAARPDHEAAQRLCDRTRGQSCSRGDHIGLVGASTAFDELLCELASKLFASCGFGRPATEKWQAEDFRDNRFQNYSQGGDPAIAIIGLAE